MNHADQGHGRRNNYNMLFSNDNNNNTHESPVRDYQHLFKKEEDQYKDYYGVSNFKFPEVTTNVYRTNHANFCELSFDGTKSKKRHHHRRNNTIKRVISGTTINCTGAAVKQEPELIVGDGKKKSPNGEEQATEKSKDTITFHYLAEQFKKKLKFIETPVKLQKNPAAQQNASTFEVILSPKPPTSYSSIETMSNILQSSDRMHKQIIVTSKTFHPQPYKPDMHDREIQTAIIGIRNVNNLDECFNMSLASVNDIFYNMDLLSSNEDTFNLKRKKRKKLNLTVTHLPCVEIKRSTMIFEMPAASSQRPQMPRRTINTNNNSIIEDYHEASNIDEPVSVTVNSSEATDNLKDKIFSLFNDSQIAATEDFPKKVNDLCTLIGTFLSESNSKHEKKIKKTVKIPSEMFINIQKLQECDSNNLQNTLITSSYSSSKKIHTNNMYEKSSSNPSTPPPRSRSVSPPSRPSTPSCQISKIPVSKSNNEINETSSRSESSEARLKKKCFDSSPNTSFVMQNHSKFSFTSIPSASTISCGNRDTKMVFDDETDEKQTSQFGKPVPRNIFFIPAHVNEILKRSEYNTASNLSKEFGEYKTSAANNDTKATEFNLVNILKKPPVKQSWVVPDFPNKSQPKCDSINSFECAKNTKSPKKSDHDCGGPSVTFSSMVDVFGGDNDSFEQRICATADSTTFKNTIVPVTGLKKSKTYPNKPELYAMNAKEETNYQNCGLFTVRQTEVKTKPIFEKQASFYNSNFGSPKKETNTTSCLQKRKDYDHKLKMQLQMQNKQPSKIPLLTRAVEQQNDAVNNQTSKATKSKLPLMIRNDAIKNKQVVCKSNMQECSKLFTTDIIDTPFSKLISENTPRINTPRPTSSILKNSLKNTTENNLNVTKDVSNAVNEEKEIIFIKHPESNFHKIRNKFKVDSENVDNILLRQTCELEKHNNNEKNTITDKTKSIKLNHSNKPDAENSLFLEFLHLQVEEKLKNQRNSPHENVIFVYRNKEKSFENVLKKDSLTKRKTMMKSIRKEEEKNRSYSKIYEENLDVVRDVTFKNSLTNIKKNVNKVTFMEPNKWASLCRIHQCNKCDCKEKRLQQKQKNLPKKIPKESKKNYKNDSKKKLPKKKCSITKCSKKNVPKKKDSTKNLLKEKDSKKNLPKESEDPKKSSPSPQLECSNIIKSCYDQLLSGVGICNKQKENNSTEPVPDDKSNNKKCCPVKSKSNRSKDLKKDPPPAHTTSDSKTNLKQITDNLIACCTTLCCNLEKNAVIYSAESIPACKRKKECKCHPQPTHWLYVKAPKMQKVNRKKSYRSCNVCVISTSKGALAKRKSPNPAWKFKELIFNKVPNDLYNIIKHMKREKLKNSFPHLSINEKRNFLFEQNVASNLANGDTKQLTQIFPISENSEDTTKLSTIRIGNTTEKVPISLKNIQIINKGRFSENSQTTTRNINKFVKQNVSIRPRKIQDTIFIPTSPRKTFHSSNTRTDNYIKEEFLPLPSKKEEINHISTSPKTLEDLKQNIPTFPFPWIRNMSTSPQKAEYFIPKIINIDKQNDIKQNTNTDETLRENKIEDRPIITFTPEEPDDTKNSSTTLPNKRIRDIHPVIFDTATRKLFENKPKVQISPRQINRSIQKQSQINNTRTFTKSNVKFQSNEMGNYFNKMETNTKLECMHLSENKSTSKIQINEKHTFKSKIKDEAEITKLPVPKTKKDIPNHVNTKTEERKLLLNKICARNYVTARKRQISKLVIESNEIVHIPDDDLIPLKRKESVGSKSTEYKSVIAYSGFSSNSQSSISSNSKKASSTSRTFFSIIGNFFRKYSKVKKKKSKSVNENG